METNCTSIRPTKLAGLYNMHAYIQYTSISIYIYHNFHTWSVSELSCMECMWSTAGTSAREQKGEPIRALRKGWSFPLLVAEPPLRGGLPQLKPSSGEDRVTRGSVSFLVVQGTFELVWLVAWQANPQKLQVQSSISQVTRRTGRSTLVGKPGAKTSC